MERSEYHLGALSLGNSVACQPEIPPPGERKPDFRSRGRMWYSSFPPQSRPGLQVGGTAPDFPDSRILKQAAGELAYPHNSRSANPPVKSDVRWRVHILPHTAGGCCC